MRPNNTFLIKLAFLLVGIFIINSSHAQEIKDSLNHLYWVNDSSLEWNDFQGETNTESDLAAYTTMALPYKFVTDSEDEITVTVKVYFDKNKSWSKKDEENDLLLKHQQLHFDIAELHRRKVIKALINSKVTKDNYRDVLQQIVKKYWGEEYPIMQNKYDDNSNFSKDIKGQISWREKIKSALNKLDDYSETTFTIKFRK